MSTTTTTTTISAADTTIIAGLTALPALVGMLLAGKLTSVNTEIQAGITTAETDIDAEIDAVHTKLDALEASNPLIGPAIAAGAASLQAAGFQTVTEAQLVAAFKAGVNGFLGGLKAA